VKVVGLTGGIGSGKSAASAILGELGATIIDADKVGHQVYEPGTPCWRDLVEAFGEDVVAVGGGIDRKKLGARVFADPRSLQRLNELVWPRIAEVIRERIAAMRASGATAPIVVEAAVLIEAGWQTLVDEVWVVAASRERAIDRVVATRGVSRGEVERRLDNQISDAERVAGAACVIPNDGTLDELRTVLQRRWRERIVPGSGANLR
jgi:dephospho-CoA kinase